MFEWITVQEAASILGISPSSVKRLCDSNRIPSSRTTGGHRRIHRHALEHFARQVTYRIDGPHSTPSETTASTAPGRVMELLLQADFAGLWEFFQSIEVRRQGLIESLETSLVPALWKVGDLWKEGNLSIAEEHAISTLCERFLDRVLLPFDMVPVPRPGSTCLAIGASFGGPGDTIAGKLVELVFRLHGIYTRNFGANLPAKNLGEAAIKLGASWVWCSYTHIDNPDRFTDEQKTLEQMLPSHVQLVVGGGAISAAMRRSLVTTRYLESLHDLSSLLRKSNPISETPPQLMAI